ncbi:uncharacterized protein BDZ99DRAFT_284947 [Mytilinidion resinicola]|uniref:Uncharacterized protein n=1 Tax=Mytilinidion resinicola TaxID=574789 RepID=A0A6A6YTT6_9PEZI|nr:uncharacterized protein BDZ99DRAFT_284947 [Mytilinidion resinicola]KAF2811988.1 hypothetical protein BDZ99DRAFT_284947 [Mytilinidion resinicola]
MHPSPLPHFISQITSQTAAKIPVFPPITFLSNTPYSYTPPNPFPKKPLVPHSTTRTPPPPRQSIPASDLATKDQHSR